MSFFQCRILGSPIHVEFLGISALLLAVSPGVCMCVCVWGVQGQTRVSSSLMVSTAALAVSFVSSQSSSLPPTELPSSLLLFCILWERRKLSPWSPDL